MAVKKQVIKKLSSKQVQTIDRHIEKYGFAVDTAESYYEPSTSLWEIKLRKIISKPCHMMLCSIAMLTMRDLKVNDICIEGVVYHS